MRLFVIVVLLVLGALAIAGGVIYLVEPAHSLPSFFPGHLSNPARPLASAEFHRKKGLVGLVVGAVLVVAAVVVAVVRPAPRSRPA